MEVEEDTHLHPSRKHPDRHPHVSSEDADFVSSVHPTAAVDDDASARAELYRSNLLRLETSELLSSVTIHCSPNAGELDEEVKWADDARSYVETVVTAIESLKGADSIDVDAAALPPHDGKTKTKEKKYWIRLFSDKAASGALSMPFAGGGPSLKIEPVGSFGTGAGLTSRGGNANVSPTLDLAVLLPCDATGERSGERDDEGRECAGMVGGKDYLDHRYFDKRNVFAVYVAKHLSRKKHRSEIGSVHLTTERGDPRTVALLLTPPTTDPPVVERSSEKADGSKGIGKTKKKKRKRADGKEVAAATATETKARVRRRVRFRVRLVFGARSDDWIPSARLFPDRSNLRSGGSGSGPTPRYTDVLSRDCRRLSVTRTIRETVSLSKSFGETLILIKVWCLQRGFLRGSDALDEETLAVTLVYLVRTKRATMRMGPIEVFTVWMKFWAEVDWLGEEEESGGGGGEGREGGAVGVDTIRHSASEGYRPPSSSSSSSRRAVLILPRRIGETEAATIAACPQAKLYRSASLPGAPKTLIECYRRHAPLGVPLLLDSSMTFNHYGSLSASFVRELIGEARDSVRSIHAHAGEEGGGGMMIAKSPFGGLFMTTRRFWTRYDAYVRIDLRDVSFPPLGEDGGGGVGGVGDGGGGGLWGVDRRDLGDRESIARGLIEVLRRALGDRVSSLRVLTTGNGDADVRARAAPTTNEGSDGGGGSAVVVVDSDETPYRPMRGGGEFEGYPLPPASSTRFCSSDETSPLGAREIVLGIAVNPSAATRIVDRGPPADDVPSTESFVKLWGKEKAQLRRFKDGAIVHAVLWNETAGERGGGGGGGGIGEGKVVTFEGDERVQGGIVERIVRHVVALHFAPLPSSSGAKRGRKRTRNDDKAGASPSTATTKPIQFELKHLVSLVEGVSSSSSRPPSSAPSTTRDEKLLIDSSAAAFRSLDEAFKSLSSFLRESTADSSSSASHRGGLGLPLPIESVEPLSPSLRRSCLFPPLPHPLLGGPNVVVVAGGKEKKKKYPGATTYDPIAIQIKFGMSSKWPDADSRAMTAAKIAMLARLAESIETRSKNGSGKGGGVDGEGFGGPVNVSGEGTLEFGYRGYAFRVVVKPPDQEMKLLFGLTNPSDEAVEYRAALVRHHIVASVHHSAMHALQTSHPSLSTVVRLAMRWFSSHMLSNHFECEVVELLVAHVYGGGGDGASPPPPPGTTTRGFMEFLKLVATYDWAKKPLIVDPQRQLTQSDYDSILSAFESVRGPDYANGPAMYVVTPNDRGGGGGRWRGGGAAGGADEESTLRPKAGTKTKRTDRRDDDGAAASFAPTFGTDRPERVVLTRASALCDRSYRLLLRRLSSGGGPSERRRGDGDDDGTEVFREGPESLRSYGALLRVDGDFVFDAGCSTTSGDLTLKLTGEDDGGGGTAAALESPYTRSMRRRYMGPRKLRIKRYRNLAAAVDGRDGVLYGWNPIRNLIDALQRKFHRLALFFHNEYAPEIIGMVWRPDAFEAKPFSALTSEYKRPVEDIWAEDGLVVTNADDVLREVRHMAKDVVADVKVLDDRSIGREKADGGSGGEKKRKAESSDDEESLSSSDDSASDEG